jgi:cephalosporin hydroxylase
VKQALPIVAAASLGALIGAWATRRHFLQPEWVNAAFHVQFHRDGGRTYNNTFFLGVPVQKCPFDLWVMQEIIHQVRPDVIVETGTYRGGSSYYYAHLLDFVGRGRVYTIDIEDYPGKPRHPRVHFLLGSSIQTTAKTTC